MKIGTVRPSGEWPKRLLLKGPCFLAFSEFSLRLMAFYKTLDLTQPKNSIRNCGRFIGHRKSYYGMSKP